MVGLSETRIVQRRIRRAWQQLLKGVNGGALSAREIGVTLSLLFSRRWWWKTLIVLLAMAAMAALGFWQLDRLDQRRAFNLQRRAALAAPPFELTGAPLPLPPVDLRDRQAVAHGAFDYARQVSIRNHNYEGQPGVYLVTPLLISGSDKAVLVNRGWDTRWRSRSCHLAHVRRAAEWLPDGNPATDSPPSRRNRVRNPAGYLNRLVPPRY